MRELFLSKVAPLLSHIHNMDATHKIKWCKKLVDEIFDKFQVEYENLTHSLESKNNRIIDLEKRLNKALKWGRTQRDYAHKYYNENKIIKQNYNQEICNNCKYQEKPIYCGGCVYSEYTRNKFEAIK